MTIEDIKNATTINTVCKFSTYNDKWGTITGTVVGTGGYDLVRSISDVVNFNTQTQQALGTAITLPPITEQEFFIIKPEAGEGQLAISYSWVDPTNFVIVNDAGTAKLTLLNVSVDDVKNALTLLLENGFQALVDTGV